VKHEELYKVFMDPEEVEPTQRGRDQFHDWESCGIEPDEPDPYFLSLKQGKKWFNVLQADIMHTYLTWEWWGFYQYWIDWKGQRWVLRHLFRWHPDPPEWLFDEDGSGPSLSA
jgi:hypothetical protein